MTKHILFALGIFFTSFSLSAQSVHHTINSVDILRKRLTGSDEVCKADQKHNFLMQNDAAYAQKYQENSLIVQNLIHNQDRAAAGVLTIPVVVHVLHKGEDIGNGTNISDAQIASAIANLNDCFSGTGSYITDIGIQFQLAQSDPNCNSTTGIIRTDASGVSDYSTNGITDLNEVTIKAISKWPNDQYYNIWIVSEIDNNDQIGWSGTQGYAYYPGAGSNKDGAVILFNSFGYDPTETLGYNLKTFTKYNVTTNHELGHALNVKHTFNGDNDGTTCPTDADAANGDECSDTPAHNRNDGDCGSTGSTCAGGDLADIVTNIMSYSSDQCQVKFSSEQRLRMRAALEGTRASLLTSRALNSPPTGFVAPVVASCTPNTQTLSNGSGILATELNGFSISSGSSSSDGGYVDYSGECSMFFEIDATQVNTMNIDVYSINFQQLLVWIDWNGDGDFSDENETQHISQDIVEGSTVSFNLIYPSSIPFDSYVRMRVLTDLDDRYTGASVLSNYCDNPYKGQAEDYTLYIQPSTAVAPTAAFTNDNSTICQNVSINFTDQSTESPTSWAWDFGDGGTSTLQNPSHTYITPGIYTVSLTSTNATGSDDEIKTDLITVNGIPNLSATSFTDESCTGNDGTATVSPSGGSNTYTYAWDASTGNQTTQTAINLTANSYNVTVTDAVSACNASTSVTVNLNCAPAPVSDFSAGQTSGCTNTAITFTDNSTNSPTSWLWNFGDGTTSSLQNPTHSYANTGIYSVSLTTTNDGGSNSLTKTDYIESYSCPTTKIIDSDCGITVGSFSEYFYCDYVPGATNYQWEFTDPSNNTIFKFRNNNQRNFNLAWAQLSLANTTYTIRVRAKVGSHWLEFGPSCQITSPVSEMSTKIITSDCGTTVSTFNEYFYCEAISGATNYQWKFTDQSNQTTYKTRGNNQTNMCLNWANLLSANTIYNVEIKALVNGVWSNFGSSCQIISPNFEITPKLSDLYCGIVASSFSDYFYCDPIPNATNYKWEFTDPSNNVTTKLRGNNQTNMSFAWLQLLNVNTMYTVRISAYVDGNWSTFGPSCNLTSPAVSAFIIGNNNLSSNQDKTISKEIINIESYPNPNNGYSLYINIDGLSGTEEEILIKLIDLQGKEHYKEAYSSNAERILTHIEFPQKLATGIYLIQIQKGNNFMTEKIIVE